MRTCFLYHILATTNHFWERNEVDMRMKKKYRPIKTVDELKKHWTLYKKVLRIAQFESELDMGVNPKSSDQADVSRLTKADFKYISRVCLLVEKRLNDSSWIVNTIHEIENKFKPRSDSQKGIRYNDELFKAGRGILEDYLEENKSH